MKYAVITSTLYFKDHETEENVTIYLKDGDEKKQIEEFIIGYRKVKKYCNVDFLYLLVESVTIEYLKKEILDITKLNI